MDIKKIIMWSILFLGLVILIFVYKGYNPIENIYFPKCIFKEMTGFRCPGCGSQRSIHYLLNFDINSAISENILLVLSIPYLLVGFFFELTKKTSDNILKWRKILFGTKAIHIILIIIVSFWILRNII